MGGKEDGEAEEPSVRAQLEIEVPEARLVESSEDKPKGLMGMTGDRSRRKWVLLAALAVLVLLVVGMSLLIVKSKKRREKKDECAWTDVELPDWVLPVSYRVHLDVEWESPYTVQGNSEVDIMVQKSTPCVVIHAQNMNLSYVTIPGEQPGLMTGVFIVQGSITHDDYFGRITVKFPSALPQPQTTLQFKFDYFLQTEAHGFYRSETEDEAGSLQQVASTQFEAWGARKAFPCFDDPHLKATFEISLTAPSGLSCLGNMPTKSIQDIGSRTRHTFESTPKMATYLTAWLISDFDSVQQQVNTMDGMKPIRAWAPNHMVSDLEEALKMASLVIPYYEDLFQTPYPLPKLDLVLVPSNGPQGAENWGLVTLRMADLLINPSYSSSHEWARVAERIAHGCAHMWFGNLVTLEHWGDLWLSEGFADYFQFFGGEVGLPGLDLFATFFASETVFGFKNEAASKAHPLSVAKEDNYENGIQKANFDGITNKKGSSILRMLHTYLTRANPLESPVLAARNKSSDDLFLKGIRSYLNQFEFENVRTADLWEIMSNTTGFPVSTWMRKWSYEHGYPVVRVDVDENHAVTVKQRTPHSTECSSGWWIPISFTTNASRKTKWKVLSDCEDMILTKLKDRKDFPVVNFGRVGYYRVHYSDEIKSRLIKSVTDEDSVLGAEDITGMLMDAYSPDIMGHANMEEFLELSLVLGRRSETAYSPWSYCMENLHRIVRLLRLGHKECATMAENFIVQNITAPVVFEALTAPNYDQGMLQGDMTYFRGVLGDQGVITAGTAALGDLQSVDTDLRNGYYRAAVANGDEELYHKVLDLYRKEVEVHEKQRLMYALGSAQDQALIKRTLHLAISDDVRNEDTFPLILFVAGTSKIAAELALDFVIEKYHDIGHKLGGLKKHGYPVQTTLMPSLASNFASGKKSDKIKKFYEDHSHAQGQHSYMKVALSRIDANRQWISKHAQETCDWFASRV